MKKLIFGFALAATALTACNSGTDTTTDSVKTKNDTSGVAVDPAKRPETPAMAGANTEGSMKEMVAQYLKIKNALANDDGKAAAAAGNAFVESMGKMDKTSLAGNKLKAWNDLSDDAKEMAEHIGKNADRLAHQREHFDMLSGDMYDMVKAFGAGQVLYKDYCPMYNDNKGAFWLSEIKEIKNPYLGKKMPTCGSLKEEIK